MTATARWTAWSCEVNLVVARASSLPMARVFLEDLLDDVDRAVSRFRPDSDLARVNAAAGRLVAVSPLTMRLVDVALDAARTTDGLTDPTVGAHVVAAGYDGDIADVRNRLAPARVPAPRPATWEDVRVDRDLRRLGVPAGVRLDLGATAKAWTADEAAVQVARRLHTPVLVEIGGDVAVRTSADRPFTVAVSERAGEAAELVAVHHGGVATSSTTARRWHRADGPAHHVVDPRTGRPAQGAWRTVSVWAPTAVEANAASTAMICLDRSEGLAFLDDRGLPARLVGQDGTVEHTRAWPQQSRAA
ncbi:FAD:protein FMN transferase [Solicola sp. PLA-1-18]|uniref:FAD:protein FMN transferase n=1 Tax=Solicola sp. PLA-1-18 TaxID=3380532 RepID=UPI003B76409B